MDTMKDREEASKGRNVRTRATQPKAPTSRKKRLPTRTSSRGMSKRS